MGRTKRQILAENRKLRREVERLRIIANEYNDASKNLIFEIKKIDRRSAILWTCLSLLCLAWVIFLIVTQSNHIQQVIALWGGV